MSMKITDPIQHAAQRAPHHPATIFNGRTRTWAEVARRVAQLAGGLRRLGVAPGDRVALLGLNSDRYLETFFAIPWSGAIVVPFNTRLSPPEIVTILKDSGARVLFTDQGLFHGPERFACLPATLQAVISLAEGSAPAGLLDYEETLAGANPIPDTCGSGDDVAALFFTSGTTREPKGVMLTHRNMMSNARYILSRGLAEAPVFLHAASIIPVGAVASLLAVTEAGGTHHFLAQFYPRRLLETIRAERITAVYMVPTMIELVAAALAAKPVDVSSLKLIRYGGSAPNPETLRETMRLLPGVRFANGYGMTETSGLVTCLEYGDDTVSEDDPLELQSVGPPVPHVEMWLVDADGKPVPPGTIGEITVRGPNITKGYWRNEALTAEMLRDGVLRTGDLGYLDAKGRLQVVDRLKDMIITSGANVYSAEVETVIVQHPAVSMCAVIGTPHRIRGEEVCAIVVPKEGQTLTSMEVILHCRRQLARYKCPRRVEFRSEPLPRTGTGKILKHLLRDTFRGEPVRRLP